MNIEKLLERMTNDDKGAERYQPALDLMGDLHVRALFNKQVSARLAADYHAERCQELEARIAQLLATTVIPMIIVK